MGVSFEEMSALPGKLLNLIWLNCDVQLFKLQQGKSLKFTYGYVFSANYWLIRSENLIGNRMVKMKFNFHH